MTKTVTEAHYCPICRLWVEQQAVRHTLLGPAHRVITLVRAPVYGNPSYQVETEEEWHALTLHRSYIM